MLRNYVSFIQKTGLLNQRIGTMGQFPRKLRADRTLVSEECKQSMQCPDPCEDEPCLMDSLPVPNSSWQEKFDEKTKESNRVLTIGTGFFLGTLIAMCFIPNVPGYDVSLF